MRHLPHLSHLLTLLLGAVLATAGGPAALKAAVSGSAPVRTVYGGARKVATAAGARLYRASANSAGHTAGLLASGAGSDSAPGAPRDHGTLRTTDPAGATAPVDLSARPLGLLAPAARGTELVGAALLRSDRRRERRNRPHPLDRGVPAGPEHHGSAPRGRHRRQRREEPVPTGADHGTTSPARILPDPGHSHRRRLLRCAHRPHQSGHRSRGRGHPAPPAAARRVRT